MTKSWIISLRCCWSCSGLCPFFFPVFLIDPLHHTLCSKCVFQEITHRESINIYSHSKVRWGWRFGANSQRGGVCAEECVLLCHLAKCRASRRLGSIVHEQLNISDLTSCFLRSFCCRPYSRFLRTVYCSSVCVVCLWQPLRHHDDRRVGCHQRKKISWIKRRGHRCKDDFSFLCFMWRPLFLKHVKKEDINKI